VLGAEGFMFGYPRVLMDLTRANSAATLGPPNQLKRVRAFPDAGFKDVVRPNVDTLYTSAFIDLAKRPFVFEMPAQAQRKELMPFMDGWTNVFAAPGTRTLGAMDGRFLLAGPHWATPPKLLGDFGTHDTCAWSWPWSAWAPTSRPMPPTLGLQCRRLARPMGAGQTAARGPVRQLAASEAWRALPVQRAAVMAHARSDGRALAHAPDAAAGLKRFAISAMEAAGSRRQSADACCLTRNRRRRRRAGAECARFGASRLTVSEGAASRYRRPPAAGAGMCRAIEATVGMPDRWGTPARRGDRRQA
jgi:hypothetical protein